MEFFSAQESLTFDQWILRAILGFIYFVIIIKFMGQRTLSQVNLLDFVIILLIGNIIAHPLSDEGLGLQGSMITMFSILILYLIGIYLILRIPIIRYWFLPRPLPLVEDGRILYENMNKVRISIDVLLSELRKKDAEDISKVAMAIWEPGGSISVFLRPQYKPLTPNTFGSTIKPFKMPQTIIKEKKIDVHVLSQIGKDEEWLLNKLQSKHPAISLNQILLATIDDQEHINVFLYHS